MDHHKEMDLDALIKERVKTIVAKQKGGQPTTVQATEAAYDASVKMLDSMAKVAQEAMIPPSSIPSGSTSGSIPALVGDITGFVEHTLNTVMSAVIAADQIIALPSNLGKAYNEPLAKQNFTF